MTSMSRQHYELIAKVLAADKQLYTETLTDSTDIDRLINAFADALTTTNPAFDRDRFLAACGLQGIDPDNYAPFDVIVADQERGL